MKAVIAGGGQRVDYLIRELIKRQVSIVVVNPDRALCERLAARYDVPIVNGDPTDHSVLDDGDIQGFDVIIALSDSDANNLIICQLANRYYGIAHQVSIVSDPENVNVFRKLGIGTVIDWTSLIADAIETGTRTLLAPSSSGRGEHLSGGRGAATFVAGEPRPGDDDLVEANTFNAQDKSSTGRTPSGGGGTGPTSPQDAPHKTLSERLTGRFSRVRLT